jgi:acyl-CoA synthetase (NDP forming)
MMFDITPYRGRLSFAIVDHNTEINLGMLNVKESKKVAEQLKEALTEVNQYIENIPMEEAT